MAVLALVYSGTAPVDTWFTTHQVRAITYAGFTSAKIGGWMTDLANGATADGYNLPAPVGSGAQNALTSLGGRLQLTTGATGNSVARFQVNGLTVQPSTDRIYAASRLRVVTTTDAASDLRIVSVNQALASDHLSLILSNGVLTLRLAKGGVNTDVATTWTPETTSYHDFAFSSDLTTVRAFVDGVQVGSTTTVTNLDNAACGLEINVTNGATAADQQTILDKAVLYTQAP